MRYSLARDTHLVLCMLGEKQSNITQRWWLVNSKGTAVVMSYRWLIHEIHCTLFHLIHSLENITVIRTEQTQVNIVGRLSMNVLSTILIYWHAISDFIFFRWLTVLFAWFFFFSYSRNFRRRTRSFIQFASTAFLCSNRPRRSRML